jgi:hypothetical protein
MLKLHGFLTLTLGENEWGVSLCNNPRYAAWGMLRGSQRRSWWPFSRLWTPVIQPFALLDWLCCIISGCGFSRFLTTVCVVAVLRWLNCNVCILWTWNCSILGAFQEKTYNSPVEADGSHSNIWQLASGSTIICNIGVWRTYAGYPFAPFGDVVLEI